MRALSKIAGVSAGALVCAAMGMSPARAQVPAAAVPVIVDTAAPIVIGAVKPKSKTAGMNKFEGYVTIANTAQITVRAKNNETWLQTFTLSQAASAEMQTIVDKGGYQWGDKVTVYYDPTTKQALKIKGKPSKPI